jgi:hypothetical protein
MAHHLVTLTASHNEHLLRSLAEVDYAPSGLIQMSRYIDDLQKEITKTDALLITLEAQTKSEREDHEKYRDSTLRRFAYRIRGQQDEFNARAEKEEKEYFDALFEESKAKRRRERMVVDLKEANRSKIELRAASQRHKELQKELDEFYESIFAGPSPEFPEEDAAEVRVRQAQITYDGIQSRLDAETQTKRLLTEANLQLKKALHSVTFIIDLAEGDITTTWRKLCEQNRFTNIQLQIDQARSLTAQASRLSESVEPLDSMGLNGKDTRKEIAYARAYGERRLLIRMQDAKFRLRNGVADLNEQIRAADTRRTLAEAELVQARQSLGRARTRLQDVRKEMFERMANVEPLGSEDALAKLLVPGPDDLPPPYSA